MADLSEEEKAMMEAEGLRVANARLRAELQEARETNRRFHRRLQQTEGPLQGRIVRLEADCEHYRRARWFEFERLGRAYAELRLIYIEAAKVTGSPHKMLHSVMDGTLGWGENNEHVFANAYLQPYGVRSIRVVDEVKRALAVKPKASWFRRARALVTEGDPRG